MKQPASRLSSSEGAVANGAEKRDEKKRPGAIRTRSGRWKAGPPATAGSTLDSKSKEPVALIGRKTGGGGEEEDEEGTMEDATDIQMNREGNYASQLFFRILIGHVVVRPPGKGLLQFLRKRSRFSEDSIVSLSLLRLINTLDRRTRKAAAPVFVHQVKNYNLSIILVKYSN